MHRRTALCKGKREVQLRNRRIQLTAGPEERAVAGLVAVGFALVFGVAARRQRLVALLAAQTRAVPVLAQRRLPLRCNTQTSTM